jgi:uncharacterized protein (DUF1800 family)
MANDLMMAAAEVNVPYANGGGASRTSTGVAPYTGTFGKAELVHLLKRTMFGATQSDIDYFTGKTLAQVVTELLTTGVAPAPPLKAYTNSADSANVAFGQTWVNAPYLVQVAGDRVISLKAWWFGQLVNQNRTIEEKLILCWHNHFATEAKIYQDARYGYKYLSTLRQNCLGDFKALTKAITLEPAMLDYLNGHLNRVGAPDENYARELQELFTVGKDLNPHFTEPDVVAAAKVLTGYQKDITNISYVFNPARHDSTNKTFSSFYGNTVISGQSGNAGEGELDDLLTMIFAHDEVAKNVVRRIYRFFVYYKIDASVEANVIEPLADTFRNNGYQIKPMLEQLFMSEHFFDVLNRSCFIKPSVDFLVTFSRELKLEFPTLPADLATLYDMWFVAETYANGMQQDLLDPPSVAGWPAYYQLPSFHRVWINTDTLPKRNQFTDFLLYVGYTKNSKKLIVDPIVFVSQFSNPSDPNVLLDEVLDLMITFQVSTSIKQYLKTYGLLSGQTQDYYWTNAWNDYINNPTDTAKKQIVVQRLQVVLKYIMNLPEYQLS